MNCLVEVCNELIPKIGLDQNIGMILLDPPVNILSLFYKHPFRIQAAETLSLDKQEEKYTLIYIGRVFEARKTFSKRNSRRISSSQPLTELKKEFQTYDQSRVPEAEVLLGDTLTTVSVDVSTLPQISRAFHIMYSIWHSKSNSYPQRPNQ